MVPATTGKDISPNNHPTLEDLNTHHIQEATTTDPTAINALNCIPEITEYNFDLLLSPSDHLSRKMNSKIFDSVQNFIEHTIINNKFTSVDICCILLDRLKFC